MTERRVRVLDGLRGVAILLVMSGHSIEQFSLLKSTPELLRAILGNSSFGVRLFFVLSGFLITTLLLKERDSFDRVSLVYFYVRRSLRIFPAFYVYVSTMLAASALTWVSITNQQFLSAATYTWNYAGAIGIQGTAQGSWYLGHLWTLALEEQFYLVWPMLFILLSPRKLLAVSLIAIFLCPIVRVATYLLVPEWRGYLGMMFHTAIDSILMGCAFAVVRHRSGPFYRELVRRFSSTIALAGLVFLPLVVSPCLRALAGGNYSITLGITLDAVCVGLLLCVLEDKQHLSILKSGLCSTWLVWLGQLSYSLYLWQQPFLAEDNSFVNQNLLLAGVCITLAAMVSYYLIEKPILSLKRYFARSSFSN